MKKIVALLAVAAFTGSVIAHNPSQKAVGKTAPRVAQDNGQDKDNGKHIGEDKEHHRHHRRHHHKPGTEKK